MMDLTKLVALITGGASGIGLGIAKELLENGIKGIAIVDIDPKGIEIAEELNSTFGRNKVVFAKADVSDKSDLKSAFQKAVDAFGNLDVVFNNAGILNEIDVELCYKVNVIGTSNCLKLAMDEYLPKYRISAEGIVINNSSLAGLDPAEWGSIPHYAATKCAVLALTQSLSLEFHYKRSGVKVMAICPGPTLTPMLSTTAVEFMESFVTRREKCTSQKVEDLTKHIIPILNEGKNGSIWRLENKQRKEVHIPKIF